LRTEVVCHSRQAEALFPKIQPSSYRQALNVALDRRDPGMPIELSAGLWTLPNADGLVSDCRQAEVDAPLETVRDVVQSLGGGGGWLYADWLWRLRGWMDVRLGGVGMRRSRIRVIPLQQGDAVDFWRVQEAGENRLLLQAEMRVPGKAWLQFCFVALENGRTRLGSVASFEPRGLFGRLYWWMLYPLHRLIFRGMVRAIKKVAESQVSAKAQGAAAMPSLQLKTR